MVLRSVEVRVVMARFEVVALVAVALVVVRPPLNASAVVVALFGKRYAKRPVTCDEGRDKFGSVVMLATLVVAARFAMKEVVARAVVKYRLVPSCKSLVVVEYQSVRRR